MFYADDSQVYVSVNPNHPNNDALDTLQQCVEHIFSWNSYAQEQSWKDWRATFYIAVYKATIFRWNRYVCRN